MRNHPSSMVSSLATIAIPLAMIVFVMVSNFSSEIGMNLTDAVFLVIAVTILAVFIVFRIWQKTTYVFGSNELIVNRNLIAKRVTNIQYSRLSSVNVQRGIVNKLFGTTTLLFNVNSSVNTMTAEATLTLKSEEADALRQELSKLIFNKDIEPKEEEEIESIINVSNAEIVLHGLIGQPTIAALVGVASFLFSLVSLVFNNGGSFIMSIVMIVVSVFPQWIRIILRYSNYRIYRVGDTITIQSGLIRNYRISFDINKINSVRIREPALARVMGKSILEAEVIGLATDGMPLLCPLKKNNIVNKAVMTLVPEHVFRLESYGQPREAFVPTVITRLICAIPFVLFTLVVLSMQYEKILELDQLACIFIFSMLALTGVVVPVLLLIHGFLAQGQRSFSTREDAFVFITGAYDKVTEYFLYDKIQTAQVRSGPIERRFGVSTCTVSILSSVGFKKVTSGLFSAEELEKIPRETMARILDGRYDYRRYL